MFLTTQEIETLTGYALPAWQRRWLDKHQWTYESAANGRVVVSRSYAESRLSGQSVVKEWVPNIASLRKAA